MSDPQTEAREGLSLQQRRALAAAAHARTARGVSPVFHESIDPTLEFFYHPRTLSVLVVLLAGFLYIALYVDPSNDMLNTKWGLVALCSVFVVVSVVLFRDGPFIRPHPAFWRVVLAFNVLYEMFLVFLLFQSKQTGRQMMRFFDPALGAELPERSYGDNCALTVENLRDGIDIFVLAHSVGWFGKTLIIRNHTMCWILSITFELLEYSLAHQLPNFNECWWDHWILDVLTCNWLGIYVGMKWCEYFKVKTYTWHGIREIPSIKGKISRAGAQFTPHSWTVYEWAPTRRFKNFAGFIMFAVLIMLAELNVFYLKSLLWVPPEHPLVIARLSLLFLFALPSAREYYEYYSNPRCKRMGAHCWMLIATLLTELLIIVKFARGEFAEPFPQHVVIFWSVVAALIAGFSVWQFVLSPRLSGASGNGKPKSD
ncbi:PSS-domain-containing protein [Martensiomyces pterosporus]|nr:PSS-domain-containing protein [Martensiomyces pterosporus]